MADADSTRRRFLEVAAGTIGVGTSVVSASGERTHSRAPTAPQQTEADTSAGHVVLTFDHASPSVHGTAFPILQEFGYPALLAAVTDRIPPTGRSPLGLERLHELQSAGWEIGSHSASGHPNFLSLSEGEIETQCRTSKQWLLDHGFASEAAAIVYPFEGANERVADIVRKHFAIGFGGPHRYGTDIVDPLLIGRVNGDDVEATREAIDAAAADGKMLGIMYHTVGADNDRVSASAFRETMAHIRSKDDDLQVITPSTLDRLLAGEPIESSADRTANGTAPTTGTNASTTSSSTNTTETPSPTGTPSTTDTPSATNTPSTTATGTPSPTETPSPAETATSTNTRTTGNDTAAGTSQPAGTNTERTAADGPGFGVLAVLSGIAGWTAYRLTRESDE